MTVEIVVGRTRLHRMVETLRARVDREDGEGVGAWVAATAGLELLAVLLDPRLPPDDVPAPEPWYGPDGDGLVEEPEGAGEELASAEDPPGDDEAAAEDEQPEEQGEEERPAPAPTPTKWTPERLALLRELWPQTDLTGTEILRRIQQLPGEPLAANTSGLYSKAKELGLPSRSSYVQPEPDEQPAPPPTPTKHQRAKELLAEGQGAHEVQRETGLPLREVLRLGMEVREERRAAGDA